MRSDSTHDLADQDSMTPSLAGQRIVVIGTGYVGLPAALMWARAGHDVVGVDIDENLVRAINDRTLLVNEQELHDLLSHPEVHRHLTARTEPSESDVFVVAVPTPVDPMRKVADLTHVTSALESICRVLRPGNLVIIESTVPPLTCRDVIKPLIEQLTAFEVPEEILLAHCPERILPGDIFQEIVHNDRLIGGLDEASTTAAAEIYAAFVEGALHHTNDLVAELSKLMENAYRDVNIALANELAQISESLGAPPDEVFYFANKHPRVNILQPGIGVGGHCIPVDPWFLKQVAPYDSRIIATARVVNDEMPARTAARIRHAVAELSQPRIVALGATYKRDCDDQRESPALKVVDLLRTDGYDVRHFDPLVPELGYGSLQEVLENADLAVVLVGHGVIIKELMGLRPRLNEIMSDPRVLILDASLQNEGSETP
jgi:UDP-N-acetyl-D-mannosaminuronic acid dehydrogenase